MKKHPWLRTVLTAMAAATASALVGGACGCWIYESVNRTPEIEATVAVNPWNLISKPGYYGSDGLPLRNYDAQGNLLQSDFSYVTDGSEMTATVTRVNYRWQDEHFTYCDITFPTYIAEDAGDGSVAVYTVTSVGSGSEVDNQSTFRSVSIPSAVTSIGDYAFAWKDIEVSFPEGCSLTEVGSYSFSGNSKLSISGWDSLTDIGSFAFYQDSLSGSISLPDIVSIGERAFAEQKSAVAGSRVGLDFDIGGHISCIGYGMAVSSDGYDVTAKVGITRLMAWLTFKDGWDRCYEGETFTAVYAE